MESRHKRGPYGNDGDPVNMLSDLHDSCMKRWSLTNQKQMSNGSYGTKSTANPIVSVFVDDTWSTCTCCGTESDIHPSLAQLEARDLILSCCCLCDHIKKRSVV